MAHVPSSAAGKALHLLDQFIGTWKTDGLYKPSPSAPQVTFEAVDVYEWVAGGHFVLHRFDADMPDGRVEGIEVIGYDSDSGSYSLTSFHNSGKVTLMRGTLENRTWRFVGDEFRFSGSFRDDGRVLEGTWELRSDEDGSWRHLMEVRLRKVD